MKKSLIILMSLFVFAGYTKAQNAIEPGVVYNFTQEPSSTVSYQINLQTPGEVTLQVKNWLSTYNWGLDYDRITITNSEGKPVSRNGFSSEEDPFLFHMFKDNTGLIFNVGQAGVYNIKVHSGQHTQNDWGTQAAQNYQLSYSVINCDDLYEVNDSIEIATAINIGSTVSAFQWKKTNTSEVWGDEDWYKIIIDTPGKLKIELVDWIGIYNWGLDYDRLFVYNADGISIGDKNNYGFYAWMMGGGTDSIPLAIEMNLTHAGVYYLQFHAGVGVSTNPYHFTTSFISAEDLFEPNDSFSDAKLISSSDMWYQAYEWRTLDSTMNVAGDEDYFYFRAPDAGAYSLTLDGWIGIYNWGLDYDRLYIYDENENSIGESPLAWMMGDTPINFEVPAAGKYFIQLHSGIGYSLDGYKFKLTGLLTNINNYDLETSNFGLFQNVPNPFNKSTKILYSLPFKSNVKINIYNQTGILVKEVVNGIKETGLYELQYDAGNLPNGIYFYSIDANSMDNKHNFNDVKKMILSK